MPKLFDFFPLELKEEVYKYNKSLADSSRAAKVNKNKELAPEQYAFHRCKKLPLVSRRNVMSAMDQFLNVKGTTVEEKEEAFKKICKAAESFKICTMGFNKKYSDYLGNSTDRT